MVKIRTFLNHFVCNTPFNCNYNGSIVNAVGAGMKEIQNKLFSIYPNPSNENITIQLNPNTNGPVNITVFNSIGQEVISVAQMMSGKQVFNVRDLPKGIYHVLVNDAKNSDTLTFVKQ
jgi:hypothetical protein